MIIPDLLWFTPTDEELTPPVVQNVEVEKALVLPQGVLTSSPLSSGDNHGRKNWYDCAVHRPRG